MFDESQIQREAALLIRPLPGSMSTGEEPIRFGGRPRLPDGVEWPAQDNEAGNHFIAEIDLARLPRHAPDGQATPEFPEQGTLFVFLPIANDGLYGYGKAHVLYTTEDVSGLPERDPPANLPNIHDSDPCHVHADGTIDDGKVLVRQVAQAIPFPAMRAPRPPFVEGRDPETWDFAYSSNKREIHKALAEAVPMPPDPAKRAPKGPKPVGSEEMHARVPKAFRKHRLKFQGHHLDWEFIFDWAKEFYLECINLTIGHLEEMLEEGASPGRIERLIGKLNRKWEDFANREFGRGKPPRFWTFNKPVAVKETFDWQARRWMALAQFQTDYPSPVIMDAFLAMLDEIDRHCHQGGSDALRIGLLDDRVGGHDKNASHAWDEAKAAFRYASDRAANRHFVENENIPKDVRWDSRIVNAVKAETGKSPASGIMPHMMFGMGFEIQNAVTDHYDDVLLLQIGDPYGLPLEIGPDMVVQLWIKPEDLATGRFDRVEMTMDMT